MGFALGCVYFLSRGAESGGAHPPWLMVHSRYCLQVSCVVCFHSFIRPFIHSFPLIPMPHSYSPPHPSYCSVRVRVRSPRVGSNSCPLSWWCYPSISSATTLFSFHLQSFPASESFPMSWLFASGGQSTGASASALVLPMNIQGWFPLGWTDLISLLAV